MTRLSMKPRAKGLVRDKLLSIDNGPFDYISELHDILWRFVRTQYPEANGNLRDWLPIALAKAEGNA